MLDGDAELIELVLIDGRGRVSHEVLGGGGFGEGDDFANGFFTGEKHDNAVDPKGDAAVGRRAIGQRVEEKAKAAAKLFFRQAEGFEEALLNVLSVNSNAAGAKLVAVEHEVIAFRTDFPRRGFEFVEIFVDDAGEGMLRADPGFVGFAPLKEREAGEPEVFPLRFVYDAERFAELHT